MKRNSLRLDHRRRIEWTEISRISGSRRRTRVRRNIGRYALHKELFDQFWQVMLISVGFLNWESLIASLRSKELAGDSPGR